MLNEIKKQAQTAIKELIAEAHLEKGEVVVIGCSSSEIHGCKIGSSSTYEIAEAVFDSIYSVLKEKGIDIACQCCEHINRAVVVERTTAQRLGLEVVSVVPQPKAGGSWATSAWDKLENPVCVEFIKADAGMDIGGTLIGMHLKHVAVPVRLSINKIGEALLLCAKTRPKYIGGSRAKYE